MNAYSTTAHQLANALLGKPCAPQTVHVSTSTYSGSPLGPRHIVLVIPEGEEQGTYYECGDRSLALLRSGMTPEDLELEALEDEFADDELGIDEDCRSDFVALRGER